MDVESVAAQPNGRAARNVAEMECREMSVSALRREAAETRHPEQQYLDLLRLIVDTGTDQIGRAHV